MRSSRVPHGEATNRLARAVSARRAEGAPLLDLSITNPTAVGLPYPSEAIRRALGPHAERAYQPAPLGLASARAALARETGARADRVALCATTREAYAWLFKLCCEAGDDVLVPQPSTPLLEPLAALENVSANPYRLRCAGDRWELDVDAIAACVGPRTRAVVVEHPNSATGAFLRAEGAASLAALCAERGLALVSDEVLWPYALEEGTPRAGTLARGSPCLAFSLGGLAKQCGLPQLKLAWIEVGGPDAGASEAVSDLERIADTYLSVGAPVQHALGALLALGRDIRGAILARVRANLGELRRAAGASAHARVLPVEAGWSALLELPATRSDEEAALALLDAGVLVQPGWLYELDRPGTFVLSLLPPPGDFADAVARLLEVSRRWI